VTRYNAARLALAAAVATLLLLHRFCAVSLWWTALPTAVFAAFLIHGASAVSSGFFMKIRCGAETPLKEIAITFDDGPHAEFTPKVLAALAEFGAPAAFFVIGRNIRGNEDLLRRIHGEGHEIGNHTFTHSYFIDFEDSTGFQDELNRTTDAIQEVIGRRSSLFRPPYGVTTPELADAYAAVDGHVVGWNVRSFDTTYLGEDNIAERVLKGIKPGAVVLFHDTSDKTVSVLKRTLRFAQQNGFKVVSLERLLGVRPWE
jgi:peptidoglycan/xylan/chitin deacetylase (PgdA/CDA1 family)